MLCRSSFKPIFLLFFLHNFIIILFLLFFLRLFPFLLIVVLLIASLGITSIFIQIIFITIPLEKTSRPINVVIHFHSGVFFLVINISLYLFILIKFYRFFTFTTFLLSISLFLKHLWFGCFSMIHLIMCWMIDWLIFIRIHSSRFLFWKFNSYYDHHKIKIYKIGTAKLKFFPKKI